MLVKAVAHHTTASFIRINGSEFVQKYLGEGPRMVRDVFRLAKENAPSIVFVDEVDAIATKRFDAQTGADREVIQKRKTHATACSRVGATCAARVPEPNGRL